MHGYQTPGRLGRDWALCKYYNYACPHQALNCQTPAGGTGMNRTPSEARWLRRRTIRGGPAVVAAGLYARPTGSVRDRFGLRGKSSIALLMHCARSASFNPCSFVFALGA